ncbi:interstitial collagenase-like isoform X2 [Dendronephthya gigantea]|nr:interstitial collagenase-like isoform X2 [Dendronephthya gigantea]
MKRSGCLYIAILCLCFVSVQSKSCVNSGEDNGKTGQLKKFFAKYGYTETDGKTSRHKFKQAVNKLKILNEFDGTTTNDDLYKFIKKPRCGNGEMYKKLKNPGEKGKRRVRRYELNPAWSKKSLKYAIKKYSSHSRLTKQQQDNIAAQAFQLWKDSVPQLNFTPSDPDVADIKIRFEKGNHDDCNQDFDGPGRILAHAYYPQKGQIHLDDDEPFTDQRGNGKSLYLVLVHEIGHALGLGHSFVHGAMMHPVYHENNSGGILHEDDINGMRKLYAPETTAPEPNCADQDSSLCARYKEAGYCTEDYEDVMIEKCRRTCELC